MFVACFAIDALTIMSLSAIATNGTVKGGGTYYLTSRSLGPEFGGAVGVIYYLGTAFNTGMNAVGLVSVLDHNIGLKTGEWVNWLPESWAWSYLWATCLLIACTLLCLLGTHFVIKAYNILSIVVFISVLSIPISVFFVQPFESPNHTIKFTGPSLDTFKSNLLPHFIDDADGSSRYEGETWQTVFGVLFPATSGIFGYSTATFTALQCSSH